MKPMHEMDDAELEALIKKVATKRQRWSRDQLAAFDALIEQRMRLRRALADGGLLNTLRKIAAGGRYATFSQSIRRPADPSNRGMDVCVHASGGMEDSDVLPVGMDTAGAVAMLQHLDKEVREGEAEEEAARQAN